MKSNSSRNWFDQGGEAYASFRPNYPVELATYLASITPQSKLAVDVGCGTGQLTQLLANKFEQVIGYDPSATQIANAIPQPNVRYICSAAENLALPDQAVDLITAAQAAHWFDLPKFYHQVRSALRKDGVIALISYGVLELEPALNERFQHFYWQEIGPFWSPERKLVDSGYSTIDFPFSEIKPPLMYIQLEWQLADFLGYLSTWSAVRNAHEIGRDQVLQNFAHDIAELWGGDSKTTKKISWKINMRVGAL